MRITVQIFFMIIMVIVAVIDIKKKEIPAIFPLLCGILACVMTVYDLTNEHSWMASALALIPGAAMLFISMVTRGGVGIGDGLMLLCMGPVFGLVQTCEGLFAALFLSFVFSIGVLVLKKGGRKTKLPFMPFLFTGMGVVLGCANFLVI